MGYRSQVGIVFYKNYLENYKQTKDLFENLNIFDEILESENDILFVAKYIKWYVNDENVQVVDRIINNFIQNKNDYENFLFIRIGDDQGDIEIHGDYYDNDFCLGYIRKLDYEKPIQQE